MSDFLLVIQPVFFNFPRIFKANNHVWRNMRRLIFDFSNCKYRIKKCGKENLDTNSDVLTAVTFNTSVFSEVTPHILVARHKYFTKSCSVRIDP